MQELARYIQDERREYRDVTRPSLVNMLHKYRATFPPGSLIAKRLPKVFSKAAEQVRKGVDEVKELEELVLLQKKRLKIDSGTEKKIGKLLPTTVQEVRALREVLSTLKDVKMDLGLSKRHLGELSVDTTLIAGVIGCYGSPSVAKVMQNAQSRQKVLGVAERFLALAAASEDSEIVDSSGEVIDVEPVASPAHAVDADDSDPTGDPE
jgi:predicted metal-dependent hydrolase